MRAALLRWYRRARRDMPWRRNVSPYRTWISEIMLQQTTVATVSPKYERFLNRFPDVRSLAAASEGEVLKHWAGLGYYCRARNLHRAASEIIARHAGTFPSDFDSVLALPGVGRYTAGAILSIAFSKPYPVVDGNVIRVFSRLFGLPGRPKDPGFVRTIWKHAENLVPRKDPGDWNQALMELGATLCTPDAPSCGICPISSRCVANKQKRQDELPTPDKRRKTVLVRWLCLKVVNNGKILIWRRSDQERLLKNLWGLPEAERLAVEPGRRLALIRHTITHHNLTVDLRSGSWPEGRDLPLEARWVPLRKTREHLVSSLWLKCLKAAPDSAELM